MSETRTSQAEQMTNSYGFTQVDDGKKQSLVDEVFHRVARRYDLMNDIMSMGLHRVWKAALVAALAPSKSSIGQWTCLDVAGGTGDIAFRIVEASNGHAHATVLDINSSMLEVGRTRAEKKGLSANLDFVEANAEELPMADNCFNAYTIAHGIRNVPKIDRALSEAYRVLKPGGRFLCLEFSEVDIPVLDRFYEQWSFNTIPRIGKLVTGDDEPYQYLVESIRKFPNQENFATMIREAGFERVTYRNFTGLPFCIPGGKFSQYEPVFCTCIAGPCGFCSCS